MTRPTMTILRVHIFHYYSSNSITSNPTVFTGMNNFCLRSVAHARASVGSCQLQSADVCLVVQTCSFDMCVCGAVYAFSRIFSPFSQSEHYYIVQYRRKKYVFVLPRLPAALLPFCAIVVDIYLLQHVFQVFQSIFSHVTIQFRRVTWTCAILTPNSRICVALIVSAPFIVA